MLAERDRRARSIPAGQSETTSKTGSTASEASATDAWKQAARIEGLNN
jgi:hypothetical protein